MRIAIAGSSGFIGKQLVAACLDQGIELVCIDRRPVRHDVPEEKSAMIRYVVANVSEDDFSQELKDCQAAVCMAAVRPVGGFSLDDYLMNLKIAGRTMENCIKAGLKNCVLVSSRSVYSNDDMPWKEEQKNIALNLYGAAKAAADDLMEFYNKTYGARFKSLRLAQVIGQGEKKGFLLKTLIDHAAAGQPSLIYGEGAGRRQYIYVKDAANAVIAACQNPEASGVFNIGMEGAVSIKELAEIIYRVFEDENDFTFDPTKSEDRNCYQMDVERMKTVLGFTPSFDVEQSIQDIREEIRGTE